jgi:hypothetical protein
MTGILYHRSDLSALEMSVTEYLSLTEKEEQIKELTNVMVRTDCTVKLLEDRILSMPRFRHTEQCGIARYVA